MQFQTFAIIPLDNLVLLEGFLHQNHPLVGAAAKAQIRIFQIDNELAIHKHINAVEHLLGNFPGAKITSQHILFKIVATIAPHILVGKLGLHPLQKGG